MTAQFLASELGNLIQDSKRKHSDLRNAAEKSLEDVKSLRSTSEIEIATKISQRPDFVNPFIIACCTKNSKYTVIAIGCLQRLSVSRALPRLRLREILEAIQDASSAGLDIQLKILQTLPSLLQNYADDVKGNLLATALNICTSLQASNNAIVTNTAAATLQQLVITVYDKVTTEDKNAQSFPIVKEVSSEDGPIPLRAAALDAYEVFNDLCLLTESQSPLFLKTTTIPKTFGLELIESILTNHAQIFLDHPEQAAILRSRVMPFIINSLSEKLTFAVTMRVTRILNTMLRFHLSIISSEGEMALGLLTYMLDHDTASWKRSLCMEVLKGLFADGALVRRIFSMYDAQEGRKAVLRDLVAAIVRVSTEKPSVIGLGPQSSIPWINQGNSLGADQALLEASGVPGIIGSSVSIPDTGVGISTQSSTIRVPCIEQLDKLEPPSVPVSYIYSLILGCISGFSEGLAKFVLPLTIPEQALSKSRHNQVTINESVSIANTSETKTELGRQALFGKNSALINPLTLKNHPLYGEIRTCADIVDQCWPAILASCSTFLYATLDGEYYRGLVRSFQKFTHVAGLLYLSTPRDAFLTTLSKAAIPSNHLTPTIPTTPPLPKSPPGMEKPSILSNAKGLISGENLVSDKNKQSFSEPVVTLNTRNLLCLRALLNLGIALGPSLDSAWEIILGTLQHADLVLSFTSKRRSISAGHKIEIQSTSEGPNLLANFGDEIKAVETAAKRLLESTVNFSNTSFLGVITALCSLLEKNNRQLSDDKRKSPYYLQARSSTHRKSKANSIVVSPVIQSHQDLFILAKIYDIANMNIHRLITYSPYESGWEAITAELILVLSSFTASASVRREASEILINIILEAATAASLLKDSDRSNIQLRLLETFRQALQYLKSNQREMSVAVHVADIDVHKIILEGLKNVLEKCGETFVDGWDVVFAIIGSVFTKEDGFHLDESLEDSKSLTTRSAILIRSAFNSLKLICSDFLSSLPNHCFITLIESLQKFCSQVDDLNISLTAVTFFWDLSDFISRRIDTFSLSSNLTQGLEPYNLIELIRNKDPKFSDTSLWMLLLLRLVTVTIDDRLELRNSALQTLIRIFDAYGDQLGPEAWSMCLESVMLKLLHRITERLTLLSKSVTLDSGEAQAGWHETTVIFLNGLTKLLTDYLDIFFSYHSFGGLWKTLIKYLDILLSFQVLTIDTAVFQTLRKILEKRNVLDGSTKNLDTDAIDLTWDLLSKSVPNSVHEGSIKSINNQNCLLAYVSALQEIYRLIEWKLDASHVTTILNLLRTAVQNASVEAYSEDIEYPTPLQKQVLFLLKIIRTDIDGVPAALINQVAEFVELPFKIKGHKGSEAQRPTYVALSKISMSILEGLIVVHSSDMAVYSTRAISISLENLATPITLKYSFPILTKSIAPWRQATITALSILNSIIPYIIKTDLDIEVIESLWNSIVKISQGITKADCSEIASNIDIDSDEEFDIQSFHSLRKLIIPALGSSNIPDVTRKKYAESLFYMSLVHTPPFIDFPLPSHELLSSLSHPRKGQTTDPTPSARSKMSYVCFDELKSLLCMHDGSDASIRLAQAAAPYLLLRAGITLQAYIVDQPLRGMMPQPLTQRKELLYILKSLVALKCEPRSFPEVPSFGYLSTNSEDGGVKKHLLRLYPLFVKAFQAAVRDQEVLECIALALDGIQTGCDTSI